MASRIKFTPKMEKSVYSFIKGSALAAGGKLDVDTIEGSTRGKTVYRAPGSVRNLKVVEVRQGVTHKNFPVVLVKLHLKETLLNKLTNPAKRHSVKLPQKFFVFLALHPQSNEVLGARVVSTPLTDDVLQTIANNPFQENVLEIGPIIQPKNANGLSDEVKGMGVGGLLTAEALDEATKQGIKSVKTTEIHNASWGMALEKKFGGQAFNEPIETKISRGSCTPKKIIFNPAAGDSWRNLLK